MFDLQLESWLERPQARWVLLGGLCVVLASLFFFALPTVANIRFGIEAYPTTTLFECIHALQNGVLAVACTWVFLRAGGGAAAHRPWLLILVLLAVGIGGDLVLHWVASISRPAQIGRGGEVVFSWSVFRALTAVAPYTPLLLWLLAGGLAVRAAGRGARPLAPDAYPLVVATQALTLAGGMLGVLILVQLAMVSVAPSGYRAMIADAPAVFFLVPASLALVVGLLIVPLWPERLRHAGALELFAVGVLMALLPGVLCVILLQWAQSADDEVIFKMLPEIMLGVYAVGVPVLAVAISYFGRLHEESGEAE
jgi:hypothetical protein